MERKLSLGDDSTLIRLDGNVFQSSCYYYEQVFLGIYA